MTSDSSLALATFQRYIQQAKGQERLKCSWNACLQHLYPISPTTTTSLFMTRIIQAVYEHEPSSLILAANGNALGAQGLQILSKHLSIMPQIISSRLRVIDLSDDTMTDIATNFLPLTFFIWELIRLPYLAAFSIRNTFLGVDGSISIMNLLRGSKTLRVLDLSCCSIGAKGASILQKAFNEFVSEKNKPIDTKKFENNFDLDKVGTFADDQRWIAAMEHDRNTSLVSNSASFQPTDLKTQRNELDGTSRNKTLIAIDLSDNALGGTGANDKDEESATASLITSLFNHPTLQIISLAKNRLNGTLAIPAILANIINAKHLRILDLSDNSISGDDITQLIRSLTVAAPCLESLSVANSGAGSSAAIALADLWTSDSILCGKAIQATPAGFLGLKNTSKVHAWRGMLQYVDFRACHIGPVGIRALLQAFGLFCPILNEDENDLCKSSRLLSSRTERSKTSDIYSSRIDDNKKSYRDIPVGNGNLLGGCDSFALNAYRDISKRNETQLAHVGITSTSTSIANKWTTPSLSTNVESGENIDIIINSEEQQLNETYLTICEGGDVISFVIENVKNALKGSFHKNDERNIAWTRVVRLDSSSLSNFIYERELQLEAMKVASSSIGNNKDA